MKYRNNESIQSILNSQVSIASSIGGISFKWIDGETPYCDGDYVYIPKIDIEKATEKEIAILRMSVDHESLHGRYTDFDFLKRKKNVLKKFNGLKDIHNSVEDNFIEAKGMKRFKGVKLNLIKGNLYVLEDIEKKIIEKGESLSDGEILQLVLLKCSAQLYNFEFNIDNKRVLSLYEKAKPIYDKVYDSKDTCDNLIISIKLYRLFRDNLELNEFSMGSYLIEEVIKGVVKRVSYDENGDEYTYNNSYDEIIDRSKNYNDKSDEYFTILNEMSHPIHVLKSQIYRIFREYSQKSRYYSDRAGRISSRRLGRMFSGFTKDVFKVKGKEIDLDLSAFILVDESGSMDGSRIHTAKYMSIMLMETLGAIGIPYALYGHSTNGLIPSRSFHRQDKIEYYKYKEFSESHYHKRRNVIGISAGQQNVDGEALNFAASKLLKQKNNNKVLFYISDGIPCHCSMGNMSISENYLRKVVDNIDNSGIVLFVFGIETEKDLMESLYKDKYIHLNSYEELSRGMIIKIGDIILNNLHHVPSIFRK